MIGRLGPKVVLLVFGIGLAVAASGWSSPPDGTAPAVSNQPQLTFPPGGLLSGTGLEGPRATFSGSFTVERGTRVGRLTVVASIALDWHLYSTTQAAGGPRPTILEVASSSDYHLTGDFVADRDPVVQYEAVFPGIPIEAFDTEVAWTAPFQFAESVDPEQLQIDVTINGQLCLSDGACELVSDQPVRATFAGYSDPPRSAAEFRSDDGHITITGYLQPKTTAPGTTAQLVLTARMADDWHVYAWAPTDPMTLCTAFPPGARRRKLGSAGS